MKNNDNIKELIITENYKELIKIITPIIRKTIRRNFSNPFYYEDLQQEIIIKIITDKIKKFDLSETSRFNSWVYILTRNHIIDFIREDNSMKKSKIKPISLDYDEEIICKMNYKTETIDYDYEKITEDLTKLQKDIINMRLNDYRITDISRVKNMSHSAIKREMLKIREKIKLSV